MSTLPESYTEHWRFETANLVILFGTTPEDMDPEDIFECPEVIEAVRSGSAEWFTAWVHVFARSSAASVWDNPDGLGQLLGYDCLGGCAYKGVREFYTSHREHRQGDYFTDMVREATGRARYALVQLRSVPVRDAA